MAIQPSTRPLGSQHILRFQGLLTTDPGNGQTVNAAVPSSATANTRTNVVFVMADLTDITDYTTRLPDGVFDNANGGDNDTAGGPSIPVPPLTGSPSGQAWAQNIRVRVAEIGASSATPLIARVDELTISAIRDCGPPATIISNADGVPGVVIPFFFTAAGITALGAGGVGVVVEIEVPYTPTR